MYEKGIMHSVDGFFKWITRLAFVNFLWLAFSVLGLFVVGVFPATVAVFSITRRWSLGEKEFSIWTTFKSEFRTNFLKANLAGWLLVLIGALLYFNYQVMTNMTGDYVHFSVFAFYLLVFFYIVISIWIFPLISHYEATIFQHIKNAFILGVGRLHYSIIIFIWIAFVLYLSLEFPSAILFFSFSVGIFGWSSVAIKTLMKLDEKAMKLNKENPSND